MIFQNVLCVDVRLTPHGAVTHPTRVYITVAHRYSSAKPNISPAADAAYEEWRKTWRKDDGSPLS